MQTLKKQLGKQKRKIIRLMKGLPPKYQTYNQIIKKFISAQSPVIFDVGAHIGESIERFKEAFPDSKIHSFEADIENFKKLFALHGNKVGVTLNNIAAGSAEETKTFYKNAKSDTSSFNKINIESDWAKIRSEQHNISPKDFTQSKYEVKLDTLDNYIKKNKIERIDVLKIDTQGFEDEVLKGASESLDKGIIKLIEAEIIVGDLYEKSLSFYDIEQILVPKGYKFYAIDVAGNLMSDPSLAFNVIYIHKSLMEKK